MTCSCYLYVGLMVTVLATPAHAALTTTADVLKARNYGTHHSSPFPNHYEYLSVLSSPLFAISYLPSATSSSTQITRLKSMWQSTARYIGMMLNVSAILHHLPSRPSPPRRKPAASCQDVCRHHQAPCMCARCTFNTHPDTCTAFVNDDPRMHAHTHIRARTQVLTGWHTSRQTWQRFRSTTNKSPNHREH